MAALDFDLFGLSTDARISVAYSNIGVDDKENTYRPDRLGLWKFMPVIGRYDRTHHFDRKGTSEADIAAFLGSARYVAGLNTDILAQLQTGASCTDTLSALRSLGRALHALQDLYSHSNYIDLSVLDQNLVNLAARSPNAIPPSTLRLTGYDVDSPDGDPEFPLHDLYPHGGFAKDYPGKNAQSTGARFNAARDAAFVGSFTFVQQLMVDAGASWAKVSQFGTLADCGHKPALPVELVASFDPNDKVGLLGTSEGRYVTGTASLGYLIFFENVAAATAAAQTVVISDRIDPARLDIATARLGPISLAGRVITLPTDPILTLGEFSTDVDLRPGTSLIVRIRVSAHIATGVIRWVFDSIDPATGHPTADPILGFLRPGEGGNVSLSVQPVPSLSTNAEIRNSAEITFDANAAIQTPSWINTIDKTAPVSMVRPLAATQSSTSFSLEWTGSDVGSGVEDFTIYYSENGGLPKPLWGETTARAGTFTVTRGHVYGFFAVARDSVGNFENAAKGPEATTRIADDNCALDVSSQVTVTRSGYRLNRALSTFAQEVTLSNRAGGLSSVALILDGLSPSVTLVNRNGVTSCASPAGSPVLILQGGLAAGASATVTLQFANPTAAVIGYAPRVIAGSERR